MSNRLFIFLLLIFPLRAAAQVVPRSPSGDATRGTAAAQPDSSASAGVAVAEPAPVPDSAAPSKPLKEGTWVGRALRLLIRDTTAPGKASFRPYPTLGFSPETSLEIGFSGLLLYYARGDSANRVSEVNAFTFVTLEGQYGLWIDHALYGHRDNFFLLGRGRIQRFPLLYWGIGPDTDPDDRLTIDASYLLLRERVLRKVVPNLFAGLEFDYQRLYNTDFGDRKDGDPYTVPPGGGGTQNLGFGAGLVYDNRHNVLNVRDGYFAELSFLDYRDTWGSDFNFRSYTLDARTYRPLNSRNVLAAQILVNYLTGDVPFNQMALLGGDQIMRGYYQGRFRDKSYLAGQVEHRWLPFKFSKRFGGTAFAAAGVVASEPNMVSLADVKPAAGVGFRYFLFPKKDIFLRFDLGFTPEGFGFYIYTGEAF